MPPGLHRGPSMGEKASGTPLLWVVVGRKPITTTVQRSRVETTKERSMKRDKYMGIDLHQATSVVYVLDSEGKLVLETIVATEASAVVRLLQSINGPLHVTFEETTPSGLVLRSRSCACGRSDCVRPAPEQTARGRVESRQARRKKTGGALESRYAAIRISRP